MIKKHLRSQSYAKGIESFPIVITLQPNVVDL